MKIFDLSGSEAMHLDQYKHVQESTQSHVLYFLKGNWIPELIAIIKGRFSDVGKGWFNMRETSKTTYDFGKLKKFLTMVRLMMEDTLLSILKPNYYLFVEYVERYVPVEVNIASSAQVANLYRGPVLPPLFQIELVKTLDSEIVYNTKDSSFVHIMQGIFERTLEEFSKIPDIEPSILAELYKSHKIETYIKSPIKSKERPKLPDPQERPLKLPDENLWLWDLYDRLTASMSEAVKPLAEYLRSYAIFKEKLKVSPDEYVLALEMEEPPRDLASIKEEVDSLIAYEKEITRLVPDAIQVGVFEVSCKNVQLELKEINHNLVSNLILFIAKRIRERILNSYNEYELIKQRVNTEPKNIEELTDLTAYFDGLEVKLDRIREEVEECFQNYQIIEDYNYRFTTEEFSKRWAVFSAPRDINSLVGTRSKAMNKLKARFLEQMKENQKVFESNYMSTETTIAGFH